MPENTIKACQSCIIVLPAVSTTTMASNEESMITHDSSTEPLQPEQPISETSDSQEDDSSNTNEGDDVSNNETTDVAIDLTWQ